MDMDLFYVLTTINVDGGLIASFWHMPWLLRLKPKDLVPSIFKASRLKKFTVNKMLHNEFWIKNIVLPSVKDVQHMTEFYEL